MIGRTLDKAIGLVAPAWGLRRMKLRATIEQMAALGAGTNSGYEAAKRNRLTASAWASSVTENQIPRGDIAQLRAQSWALYRNNPTAKKVCRTLQAKIVGRGLRPQSQAIDADGDAAVEFRNKALWLWNRVGDQLDYRGAPGRGGQHFTELCKTALLGVILGGEVLYALRSLDADERNEQGLDLPLQLQLLHAERLADENRDNPLVVQGVEFANGRRVAYYLTDSTTSIASPKRTSAQQIGHLFVADDIEQIRGVPWFASALMQLRDTGDYQYNELKASAVAACVALGIRRPQGTSSFGLEAPQDYDLTDTDGNRLSYIQPGMILDLGKDGDMQGFNPNRPNNGAADWIQHLVRTTAIAFPGVKGSTLTGDYRRSSFSSERSSDNDNWPELESVQDWFVWNFVHPVYQEVIRTAFLAGVFADVVTDEEFADRERDYLSANWQGPVALSINPVDDATAAAARIKGGISSPQIEAAKVGRDWQQILRDISEFYDYAEQLALPDEVVNSVLGLGSEDVIEPAVTTTGPDGEDLSSAETETATDGV